MAEVEITEQNFEEEVLNYKGKLLLDFWAPWCGPCNALGPVLKEIAEEYEGEIKVGKVHVDKNPNLAMRFAVSSIPAVFAYNNGERINILVGLRPKEQYIEVFNQE